VKVVVVGGGAIGCAIAYYLTEAGADVTLLEKGEIAQEASSAAAGMLVAPFDEPNPQSMADLQRASLALYPSLIRELRVEAGIDVEYEQRGLIRPASSEENARVLKELAQRPAHRTSGVEWVEGAVLRQLEPGLTDRLIGATFSPNDAELNPGLLARAFAAAAAKRGAVIRRAAGVTSFVRRGQRVIGVRTGAGNVDSCDAVVLASGPWTRGLAARLSANVPTVPRRGQMVAYRSTAVRHIVWGEEGYLVPKRNRFLFAGATVEDVGFRRQTTNDGVAGLRAMAGRLAPVLRGSETASEWAGLRPGSSDGLPIMGALPGTDNAYVATGHFRSGILLAPITGKLMSELIMRGETSFPLDSFSPARFAS